MTGVMTRGSGAVGSCFGWSMGRGAPGGQPNEKNQERDEERDKSRAGMSPSGMASSPSSERNRKHSSKVNERGAWQHVAAYGVSAGYFACIVAVSVRQKLGLLLSSFGQL